MPSSLVFDCRPIRSEISWQPRHGRRPLGPRQADQSDEHGRCFNRSTSLMRISNAKDPASKQGGEPCEKPQLPVPKRVDQNLAIPNARRQLHPQLSPGPSPLRWNLHADRLQNAMSVFGPSPREPLRSIASVCRAGVNRSFFAGGWP